MAKKPPEAKKQREKVDIFVHSQQWENPPSSPRINWRQILILAILLGVGILFALGFLILAGFVFIVLIVINIILFIIRKLTF